MVEYEKERKSFELFKNWDTIERPIIPAFKANWYVINLIGKFDVLPESSHVVKV